MKAYCGVLDACDTTQRVSPDLTADSKPAVPLPGLETSPGRMTRAGKEQVRPDVDHAASITYRSILSSTTST